MIKYFKSILLILIGITMYKGGLAQDAKPNSNKDIVKLTTGFGFFEPMKAGGNSNIFFSKIVFRLPSNIYIGLGMGTGLSFNTLESRLEGFKGERFYDHYGIYNLYLEKHFVFGNKKTHELNLGTGIIFEEIKYAYTEIDIYNLPNGTQELVIYLNKSNTKQNNLGSLLEVNYTYLISKVGIGLRVKSHLLLDIGFGGLIIAPTISVKL